MQWQVSERRFLPEAATRRRLLRYLLPLVVVALLALALIAFLNNRPLAVSVAQIERNVAIQVYGLGTVEARILSDVGFEVAAALSELHADHGDRVNKDQVLAKLHSAEQEAKVVKAKAGVLNAEAALEAAKSALGKSEAIRDHREAVSKRRQELLGKQVTSVEAAADAAKEAQVARAEVASAQSNIAVAKAHLEDAKAQLEFEKVLLEHHVLTAPYDALVVKRHKELGAVLKAGETLFTLIEPTSVWALAYVDEGRAGDIRVGQPAEVKLRSMPRETFKARVERIGIESDRVSEERRVYVKCEQCPPVVHLGEQVEVLITTGTMAEALLVPEKAIQGFDGARGTVWVVDNGKLRQHQIGFGPRTNDGRVVVAGEAPQGALIATVVPRGAIEGRYVRISSEAGR